VKISLRQIAPLCAVAGALFAGTASAAVKLSDVFDGNYFSPSEGGRGISILVAPRPDGSSFFFGAMFTFDENGEPTWLILFVPFLEHQFENTEVAIARVTGGAFGFPFDPGAVSEDPVGTATVRVNSCNGLFVDLDMDDGSGFPDVTLGNLQPVDGPADTCVYRTQFDGCPAFAQADPNVPRGCRLNGVITQDITLTNDTTWVLNGLVRIGNDNANSAEVTIEPGTVLIGAGQTADYLYVSPGSKIFANGTTGAPIVLTSPQDGFIEGTTPAPGDVGGLVVSGNAPSNACPNAPFNCFSEFDQTQRFGGDDPHDSSGEISYMQVRYAGIEFQPNAEVNAFTFQGVGDGTTVHHLQAFRGQDDGVEFFGGTVNVNYMVVTEGGDDGVDWDLGYSGNLQYGLVFHGEGFGEDYGIEGASNPDSFDALPRATPTLANYTFLGNGNGSSGIQFKDGSGGRIFNTIVSGFAGSCIRWDDAPATYNAAGTPAVPNTDVSAFNGVIIDCSNDFTDAGGAPYSVSDFFNSSAFENNEATDPQLNVYMPQSNSPALTGGVDITTSEYFDYTSYRGGFDAMNDWTIGWTHQVTGGQ
jgi:hypothetical protein